MARIKRLVIGTPVHQEIAARLVFIDREDYSGVMRKAKEELTALGRRHDDDHLRRGVYALKQYYAVALLDPANPHAISAEVDPFWHAHILHTEQYVAFCQNLVGEYMHHRPLDRSRPADVAGMKILYDYTQAIMPKLFGEVEVDRAFWPIGEAAHAVLICHHKGNQGIYPAVQKHRLFEPAPYLQEVAAFTH